MPLSSHVRWNVALAAAALVALLGLGLRSEDAVISVGARNSYGHPHPDLLARYDRVPLYRTDLDGDVTIRSDGVRLWVARARARATVAPSATTPKGSHDEHTDKKKGSP